MIPNSSDYTHRVYNADTPLTTQVIEALDNAGHLACLTIGEAVTLIVSPMMGPAAQVEFLRGLAASVVSLADDLEHVASKAEVSA